jgi:molybdopterin-guanine dinucleotide biosynthesis protein A
VIEGETFAERAWRLLGETCDERLAVGKVADALDLPFPVFDDSDPRRVPIVGVVAGLRAARHDVCLVLPVDCPALGVEGVRALLAAQAVSRSGPLPGVYFRAHLAELERRLAHGELSLRGVNARAVDLGPQADDVDTPEALARLR